LAIRQVGQDEGIGNKGRARQERRTFVHRGCPRGYADRERSGYHRCYHRGIDDLHSPKSRGRARRARHDRNTAPLLRSRTCPLRHRRGHTSGARERQCRSCCRRGSRLQRLRTEPHRVRSEE
jgi:hypothetical protein